MVSQAKFQERYESYSGRVVSLDGYPARVVGYRLDFATVTTWGCKVPRLAVQYSWDAVKRIVSAGAEFTSL